MKNVKKLICLLTALFFLVSSLDAGPLSGDAGSSVLALSMISDKVSDDADSANAIDDLMKSLFRPAGDLFDGSPYNLEGNYVIVQEESGNLNADGKIDRVRLVALRKQDGIFDRALLLEVKPFDGDPLLIRLSEDIKGFESKIELKSFTSANKSEIMLSVQTGSKNNDRRFFIIEVKNRASRLLYDSEPTKAPVIMGKFLDKYRAEIFIPESDTGTLIDLSPRKERYDKNYVYNANSGVLRSPIKVWASGQSTLQPVDVDSDGVYELKGVVELNGVGRADRIAYVDITRKYIDGNWRVLDYWVAPAEDLSTIQSPRSNVRGGK